MVFYKNLYTMPDSTFRGVIDFLGDIGIYDVVLPFILIFTVVFAILEKTKVFGFEEVDGEKYTKKNLNSMTAFVIAFLAIASTRVVATINESMANITVLLLVLISFLLLIGTFFKEGEDVYLEKGPWRTWFMIGTGIAVALIFLHAIPTDDGEPWLEWFWDYLEDNWDQNWVGSLILVVVVIAIMFFIVRDYPKRTKKDDD